MLSDRLSIIWDNVIKRITNKYNYAFTYEYKTTFQHQDNSLNLDPTDANPKMSPLPNVPIKYDNPANKATVPNGSICYVRFAGGNPDKPFVDGFQRGDYTLIEVGDNGFKLACQGDMVASGGLGTAVILTPIPPNISSSVVPGFPYLISFGSMIPPGIPPLPAPAQGKLGGSIITGRPKFKAA